MVEFVNSLASSINASSLSPRATILFNQAMATGRYRWGRKSKLVAGACLSLALREYNRPDALYDVAYLLGESFPTLVRTLSSITTALGLSFTASDPRAYFPNFQAHLSSLLQHAPRQSESDVTLPTSLIAQLMPLSLHTAVTTATSLATLFARFGPDHFINGLPVPATACAMFLLALEAELRAPLERLSDLAACLGPLCHAMRSILMARYKLVQEEVLVLIEYVPWLDKYQSKNGRAKVGKRAIVAKGLKDVLLFQEEIWRGRLKPTVELDISDGENNDYLSEPQSECTTSSVPPPLDRTKADSGSRPYLPSKKRRKIGHKPLHDAAQFLLDPLSAPIPSFYLDPSSVKSVEAQSTHSPSSPPHSPRLSSDLLSEIHPSPPSMAWTTALPRSSLLSSSSYLLTAPNSALISPHPPTRLQLLTASRGGETAITDDELFEGGELETLFRSEQEINSLREAFGWGDWEDRLDSAEEGIKQTRKKRRRKGATGLLDTYDPDEDGDGAVEKRKISKRVNLEALAQFLEDPTEEKEDQYDYDTAFLGLQPFYEHQDEKSDDGDDWQDGPFHGYQHGDTERLRTPTGNSRTPLTATQDSEEVVINEWRPLSPETGIRSGSHSHYDEECD